MAEADTVREPERDWLGNPVPPVVWRGVAQLECSTLRELQLREGAERPERLFCYAHAEVEPVARFAVWEAVDAVL